MKRPKPSSLVALLAITPLFAAPPAPAEDAPAEDAPAEAAEPAPKPCSAPEATQFDFWVGEWDAAWGEDGQGTNVITKELGGCVVSENFSGAGLEGRSWTVWVPALGIWKQTWVDDSGGYLDFTGGWGDEQMVLAREAPENPKATHQRMVFRDIREDSFTWDWESSSDGGETWTLRWQIHYTRRS